WFYWLTAFQQPVAAERGIAWLSRCFLAAQVGCFSPAPAEQERWMAPMKFAARLCCTAVIILGGFTADAYAQSGCSALETQNSLLYISYDRTEKGEIWLSLHNNTTCAIYVETNYDLKAWRVLRYADGTTKLEIRRGGMSNYDLVTTKFYAISFTRCGILVTIV
ncbi:MAG: hypothetical protein ACREBG_20960, partial [Pyrinomonadaceae bacterium]